MNKDKMELEESIKQCKTAIKCIRSDLRYEDTEDNFILAEAVETVLQALESYKKRYELAIEQNVKDYKNSIPKKKIEDKIKEVEKKFAERTYYNGWGIIKDFKQLLEEK